MRTKFAVAGRIFAFSMCRVIHVLLLIGGTIFWLKFPDEHYPESKFLKESGSVVAGFLSAIPSSSSLFAAAWMWWLFIDVRKNTDRSSIFVLACPLSFVAFGLGVRVLWSMVSLFIGGETLSAVGLFLLYVSFALTSGLTILCLIKGKEPKKEPAEPANASPDPMGGKKEFASICDFSVLRLKNQKQSVVRSLRAGEGHGYAEHHKDWLRLGCELSVEEEEADSAFAFLSDPVNAGTLDSWLEAATEEFIRRHLSEALFRELSCSFYLYEKPMPT